MRTQFPKTHIARARCAAGAPIGVAALIATLLTGCWTQARTGPTTALSATSPSTITTSFGGNRLSPDSWMNPRSIPLDGVYRWTAPASLARPAAGAKFAFEEACHSTRPSQSNMGYGAISERARWDTRSGGWQGQQQIIHWPGDSLRMSQTADLFFQQFVHELQDCAHSNPNVTLALTSAERTGVAATITASQAGETQLLHEYFVLSACGAAISELAVWATTAQNAQPEAPWQAPQDKTVFESITDPLCQANQGH